MKEFEYFIPQLKGWISLTLEAYFSLLILGEDSNFTKIKIPKNLPLSQKDLTIKKVSKKVLIPGNYIEVKINQELSLECNPKNGRIQLISGKSNSSINYEVWYRGKIISYDDNSKLLFVEINDNIEIIDNFDMIRPLKEIKYTKSDLLAYEIKQIQNSEYDKIKNEFERKNEDNNDIESNLEIIFDINYNINNSTLLCIGSKDYLKNLLILKQYEEKHKKRINEDHLTNSDISNPNSNNNLIGIKSPSGHSENSDFNNSSNKNIKIQQDMKDEINSYKFRQIFSYRDCFKKNLEEEFNEVIENCKFYVGKNYENKFDVILCSNDEQEFNEEKNLIDKKYKEVNLEYDEFVKKSEINNLAMKSKVKFINIDKKYIYLVGEEKNIKNFKAVLKISKQYSKEIQKESKEKDDIQKELESLKKKHKIKK